MASTSLDAAGRQRRGAARRGRAAPVADVENYDVEIARALTAGADVRLDRPQPPNDASGTSGMKAALNGVPTLGILDGRWIEGHVERSSTCSISTSSGPTSGEGARRSAPRDRRAGRPGATR